MHREVGLLTGNSESLPTPETVFENLNTLAQPLISCIGNTQEYLHQAWKQKNTILFEGAQATMLDIDHGTYPFVTSSNCSIGGLFTGTGLPHKVLDRVVGVSKAYTTRVGSGPFPSELTDSTGERLRSTGHEFGTTTGRPRRCGWFDAVILRHACRVNGVDGIGLMKLDVLDGMESIGIVNGYQDKDGNLLNSLPSSVHEWENIKPTIEYLSGWSKPTRDIKSWDELPTEAQKYLKTIEKMVETPVSYVSTGPDRQAGFVMPDSWLKNVLG
jgi:adenylosuccinate synthase